MLNFISMLMVLFSIRLCICISNSLWIQYQMVCQQQEQASSQQARAVLEQGVRQHPSASHLKLELVQCILRESDTDAQIMKGEEEMKRLFFKQYY